MSDGGPSSFISNWGFVIATNSEAFTNLSTQKVNKLLEQRLLTDQLKHYDGETHQHMFSIPKTVRKLLKSLNKN